MVLFNAAAVTDGLRFIDALMASGWQHHDNHNSVLA